MTIRKIGFSMNTVGLMWVTGRPDQLRVCSASQC